MYGVIIEPAERIVPIFGFIFIILLLISTSIIFTFLFLNIIFLTQAFVNKVNLLFFKIDLRKILEEEY